MTIISREQYAADPADAHDQMQNTGGPSICTEMGDWLLFDTEQEYADYYR